MNSIKQLIHKSTKSSLRRDTRQRVHYITCTLISRLEWQMIYGVVESHFDTVGGRYYFISVFRKKRGIVHMCMYTYVTLEPRQSSTAAAMPVYRSRRLILVAQKPSSIWRFLSRIERGRFERKVNTKRKRLKCPWALIFRLIKLPSFFSSFLGQSEMHYSLIYYFGLNYKFVRSILPRRQIALLFRSSNYNLQIMNDYIRRKITLSWLNISTCIDVYYIGVKNYSIFIVSY